MAGAGTNGYTDHWAERLAAAQRLSISAIAVGVLGYGFVRVLDALVRMCSAMEHAARFAGN